MNKTIYLTYDEATRLVDACKDSGGSVTKEFFDWYLGKGRFFAKMGIIVIDNLPVEKERVAVSFDFSNPDASHFISYRYSDQKVICKFLFRRQENLTMDKIEVEIQEFSSEALQTGKIWFSPEIQERITAISDEVARAEKKRRLQKMKKTKQSMLIDMAMKSAYVEINKFNCRAFIYFLYALMFNATKQEPEEIPASFHGELDVEREKVKALYRYSGYVNLTDNRIYRPAIKKDPNEPVREYQRHIQKWSVRGHYRRTAKGLIWIEEHTKGEGELEKRVYGTQEESEVPVLPKVFEVFRNKRNADAHKGQSNRATFRRFLEKVVVFFTSFFTQK